MRKDTSRRFTISSQGLEILKKDKGEFAKIKVLAESDENGKFPDVDIQKEKSTKPSVKSHKEKDDEIVDVTVNNVESNKNEENAGDKSEQSTGQPTEEKGPEENESADNGDIDKSKDGGLSQSDEAAGTETKKQNGGTGEIEFTEEDPGDDDDIE